MLLQDSCHDNIIAGWSQLAIREQLESTGSAGMMASTWASQWLSQLQCQAIYFMYWTAISFWFQYRLWNTNLCVPQSFYHFFFTFLVLHVTPQKIQQQQQQPFLCLFCLCSTKMSLHKMPAVAQILIVHCMIFLFLPLILTELWDNSEESNKKEA